MDVYIGKWVCIPRKEFPQREGAGGTPGPEEDDIPSPNWIINRRRATKASMKISPNSVSFAIRESTLSRLSSRTLPSPVTRALSSDRFPEMTDISPVNWFASTNRENLVVLAGPANRDVTFQHDEQRHIQLRGFIKNFTGLYRPKPGDGPNAVYLLRTQIGIVPHRTRSLPRACARRLKDFDPQGAGSVNCRDMHANAISHWCLSGSCVACQPYDIQRAPNHAITSLCGLSACSK